MPITPFSTPPSSTDPDNFDDRADQLLAVELPRFVGEADDLTSDVNAKQVTASGAATTATTKATEASNSATAAANSADDAATKADAAAASASAALASETAAGTSDANASASATAAANSAASIDAKNLNTDYFGDVEPAIMWPGMRWAHQSADLRKRRNAANSEWVVEGPLLARYMPGLLRVVTMSASGTYTPGAGAESAEIEIWGGGGGNATDGGTSTFVAPGVNLSAGGGASTNLSTTPSGSAAAPGGDLNLGGTPGTVAVQNTFANEAAPGVSALRGGAGAYTGPSGVAVASGQTPRGSGSVIGGTTNNILFGSGRGAYVYKFLATLPASATVVIGAGSGSAANQSGGAGLCVIKEYGRI